MNKKDKEKVARAYIKAYKDVTLEQSMKHFKKLLKKQFKKKN